MVEKQETQDYKPSIGSASNLLRSSVERRDKHTLKRSNSKRSQEIAGGGIITTAAGIAPAVAASNSVGGGT